MPYSDKVVIGNTGEVNRFAENQQKQIDQLQQKVDELNHLVEELQDRYSTLKSDHDWLYNQVGSMV